MDLSRSAPILTETGCSRFAEVKLHGSRSKNGAWPCIENLMMHLVGRNYPTTLITIAPTIF